MNGTGKGHAPERERGLAGRLIASLAELCREERAVWSSHYKRYFKIAARVLGLGFVAGFAFFLLWPEQEKRAFAYLLRSLGDIPLGAPPLVLALTLFYHNARASLLAVAAGGLPFLCLPILDPFVNGAALGLLASISKHQGLDVPLLFLKSVVPHGLFELPAVLYATSAGLYLSVSLGKEVRAAARRRRAGDQAGAPAPEAGGGTATEAQVREAGQGARGVLDIAPGTGEHEDMSPGFMSPFLRYIAQVARSFLLVVLPLLLVAALVEAFITPMLH